MIEDSKLKAIVVYSTRYGATKGTSEEIARILQENGFHVRVVDAKQERVQSIGEFDIIIVGSGIQMGKWTIETEDFVKKFQKELRVKKVAIFVSCGGANPLSEGEQKEKEMTDAKRKYLEKKAVELKISPVALGFFGGCYDFNKMSWFFKKTLSSIKPKLEAAGYKETKVGVYDLRDLNGIRNWAKEVAKMANEKGDFD